jgi:AcrR family transcriptional regulator
MTKNRPGITRNGAQLAADPAGRLSRAGWVAAARAALIGGGIAAVKVETIAKALKVTTGSFYWHYRGRQDLLDDLLTDWETTNSAAFFEAAERAGADPRAQMDALVDVWIEERGYSAAYDSAVRDWARTSKGVARAVRRIDQKRIKLLERICAAAGHSGKQAFIRARITYFHQVGYYALDIHESRARRRSLKPLYMDVLL